MNKISKTTENYTSVIDDSTEEGIDFMLKNIIDKINEIVEWINNQ